MRIQFMDTLYQKVLTISIIDMMNLRFTIDFIPSLSKSL